jgi:hypothetical protein
VGHIKVNNSKDVPKALAFLKALELESGPARGKVTEWLFVRQHDTYKKLVDRRIVNATPYHSEHYSTPPISQSLEWFKDYAYILEYPIDNMKQANDFVDRL